MFDLRSSGSSFVTKRNFRYVYESTCHPKVRLAVLFTFRGLTAVFYIIIVMQYRLGYSSVKESNL